MNSFLNRKLNRLCLLIAATLVFPLLNLGEAGAAPTLSIEKAGDKNYKVQASNLDGVSGIDIIISYNPSSLTAPSVTQGGVINGAMLSSNVTSSNSIRVAVISATPLKGSGTVLQINFASRRDSGDITLVSYKMIDDKGASVTPSENPATESDGTTTTTTNTNTNPYTGQYIYPGTFYMPDNTTVSSATGTKPASSSQEQPSTPLSSSTAPEKSSGRAATDKPISEQMEKTRIYKSLLDRFQTYKGELTLSALSALFKKNISDNFVQEPAILISDGKATARLTISLNQTIGHSPNFALSGAKLVSLKAGNEKGIWIIELLPHKNVLGGTLSVMSDAALTEYPLNVAPPVAASLKLDEAGFKKFLKETGTPQAPLNDLNQDGLRDYKDLYVFVANYLHSIDAPKSRIPPKTKTAAKSTAASKAGNKAHIKKPHRKKQKPE